MVLVSKLDFSQLVCEEISLVDYSPNWPQVYLTERRLILEALARKKSISGDVLVEHIGSTAVPNLKAKPIVDMLIGLESINHDRACISVLSDTGYCYYPEFERLRPRMRFMLKRGDRGERQYHLQIVTVGSMEWLTHIAFRDILRTEATVAFEYEALKVKYARRFRYDRLAYVRSKTAFIENCLTRYGCDQPANRQQ